MKKRFLTFVMSYLVLAAFIGSAEAKTIDTTYDRSTGAGLIQLIADSGSRITGEPNDVMEWLLALYGIEAGSDLIFLEVASSDSADEVLPASEENEEDFSRGDNLAGLVHDDSFWNQNTAALFSTDQPTSTSSEAASDDSTVQATVPGSPPETPAVNSKPIPTKYLDPPTVVYIGEPTRPKKGKNRVESPASSPEKFPEAVNQPAAGDIPTLVVISEENRRTLEDHELAAIITDVQPSRYQKKPFHKQKPERDPEKIKFPDDNTINPPAPVPEPATMLLFSTGIAGLAFSSLRRNKKADEKKGRGEKQEMNF